MSKSLKIVHWLPRILCILAILFISMFAADALGPGKTLWQQLGGVAIHLIPSFVLLAFLLIAWKWEYAGGIIFIVIGLVFTPVIFWHNYRMNHSVWISLGIIMLITFPFVVVGVLFLVSHFYKKRNLPAPADAPVREPGTGAGME
jgi:cell division protein FtsW (lipid II flippase)